MQWATPVCQNPYVEWLYCASIASELCIHLCLLLLKDCVISFDSLGPFPKSANGFFEGRSLSVFHMRINTIPSQKACPRLVFPSFQLQLLNHPACANSSESVRLLLKRFFEDWPTGVEACAIEGGREIERQALGDRRAKRRHRRRRRMWVEIGVMYLRRALKDLAELRGEGTVLGGSDEGLVGFHGIPV